MIGLNIFEGMVFMMILYLGLEFMDRAWGKGRKCLRDWIQGDIAEKKLSYFTKIKKLLTKLSTAFRMTRTGFEPVLPP